MNNLLKSAIVTLMVSIVAFIWGYSYIHAHRFGGIGGMFGAPDPTYEIANWSMILGVLVFFVGIGLLIGGSVRRNSSSSFPRSEVSQQERNSSILAQFCTDCGSKLQPGEKFCPNCGAKIE